MQSLTKTVAVDGGVSLHTEATGERRRGTILLAMGATASMLWWPQSLLTGLVEQGFQVIRFDHRDTGQSTTNAPGDVRYDIFDLAGDLIAILDAYGVEKAHLVGMSLGGYVAQIAAIDHPDRVLSLTLIASEPLGVAYEGEGIAPEFMEHFGAMGELDWSNRDAVARFLLRIAELSAGPATGFDAAATLRRIENELSRTTSMQSAFNHSMVGGELGEKHNAARLALPVLLIHGSKDPIISVNAARASAETIPGAHVLVLEGRGHELVEADVPQIAEAIGVLAGQARG